MSELVLENKMNLPKNWCIATFNDVSEKVTVGYVSKITSQYVSKGIPFFRSKNVRENFLDEQGVNYISKEFHNKISKSKLEPNDILVIRSGDIGTSCVIPGHVKEANCSDLSIIKNPKGIIPSYGAYYLNSIGRLFVHKNQVGIGLPHFNTMTLGNMTIPIPPLNEQKRIVEKIEKLFTKIESIKYSLKLTKLRLEQYGKSVLKHTFDQLAENHEYKKMDDLCEKITDGEHLKPIYIEKGVPFLTAKNVQDDGITFDNIDFISKRDALKFRKRCNPQKNDILLVSRGATVGRLCLVGTEEEFCLLGSVILIKTTDSILPEFLSYFLKSPRQQRDLVKISGSTAQQAIYLRDIKKTLIPLPSQ